MHETGRQQRRAGVKPGKFSRASKRRWGRAEHGDKGPREGGATETDAGDCGARAGVGRGERNMNPYYGPHAGITIYHGDALEILADLPEKADLLLTDPPFFMPAQHYSSRAKWQKSWGEA